MNQTEAKMKVKRQRNYHGTLESEMSGTELWVHSEYKFGQDEAKQDFLALEKKLIGKMAKTAYISELSRLLGVKGDPKKMTEETEYPATKTVHWATGPVNCCEEHAAKFVALRDILGIYVAMTDSPEGSECSNCVNESEK